LRRAGHNLPLALIMLKAGASAREARQWLTEAGGNIRVALENEPRKALRVKSRR
jgi:N-acetylmuramic acid 6-phosphate (MurNAc-6-P) etherase